MELHDLIARIAIEAIKAKDTLLENERKDHDRQMNKLLDKQEELHSEVEKLRKSEAQAREALQAAIRREHENLAKFDNAQQRCDKLATAMSNQDSRLEMGDRRLDEALDKAETMTNEHYEFRQALAMRLRPVRDLIEEMAQHVEDNYDMGVAPMEVWLKALRPITHDKFVADCGKEPEQDDLERCNCIMAGLPGHESCRFGEYMDHIKKGE